MGRKIRDLEKYLYVCKREVGEGRWKQMTESLGERASWIDGSGRVGMGEVYKKKVVMGIGEE